MMNEHDLMEALQERAADVPVGPAPLDTMARGAASTRRRHTLLTGLAAAAAVSVAVVGVVAVLPDDEGGTGRDDSAPVAADADVPPEGFRYVAMDDVAIAVPDTWPRNDVECNGVAKVSTYVVIEANAFCSMYTPFPADTDAVAVSLAPEVDTTGWAPIEVDGLDALRSPTTTTEGAPEVGGVETTMVSVYLSEQQTLFAATSSVSPERVDELLDGIVRLDAHTGVPGYADLDGFVVDERPVDVYRQRLEAAGLEVEVVDQTDRRRLPSGTIVSVTPEPGTLLEPGATVTVTAAR